MQIDLVRDVGGLDEGDHDNEEDEWCDSIWALRVDFLRHMDWIQDEIESKKN